MMRTHVSSAVLAKPQGLNQGLSAAFPLHKDQVHLLLQAAACFLKQSHGALVTLCPNV